MYIKSSQKTLLHLAFVGCGILYALRVNLSMAIVAMVSNSNEAHISNECYSINQEISSNERNSRIVAEFSWDENTQGNLLAAFFYGYMFTNLLGGRLAELFGGKVVYGFGILLTSVLSLVLPIAARYSIYGLFSVRFIQGLTEGVCFPSVNSLMARWVAPCDRSKCISYVMTGMQFGTVVTMSSSGILIEMFNWPSVFYIFGLIGCIWSVFWFQLVADSPIVHPTISKSELNELTQVLGETRTVPKGYVPWRSILTSGAFIALVAGHFGHNWGSYCLLTELPSYLSSVHHFNIRNNGLLSSLPFLFMWFFSTLFANWADNSLKKHNRSLLAIRRIAMFVSLVLPALLLLGVSMVGCRSIIAVCIISLAVSFTGACYCGYHCGFQELAPNFAGTLTGISNTFATIPGFMAPLLTGAIINKQPTIEKWQQVFFITSCIYVVGAIIYLMLSSVKVQSWNHGRLRSLSRLTSI